MAQGVLTTGLVGNYIPDDSSNMVGILCIPGNNIDNEKDSDGGEFVIVLLFLISENRECHSPRSGS